MAGLREGQAYGVLHRPGFGFVTPQNVIIAAKCSTNAKCNNINAKYNNITNAKCNNFPTQNVIIFLKQNVITQIVITPELQICSTWSKISNSVVNLCLRERIYFFLHIHPPVMKACLPITFSTLPGLAEKHHVKVFTRYAPVSCHFSHQRIPIAMSLPKNILLGSESSFDNPMAIIHSFV